MGGDEPQCPVEALERLLLEAVEDHPRPLGFAPIHPHNHLPKASSDERVAVDRIAEVAGDLPGGEAVLLPGHAKVVDHQRQAALPTPVREDAAVVQTVVEPPVDEVPRLPRRGGPSRGCPGELQAMAPEEEDLVRDTPVVDAAVR